MKQTRAQRCYENINNYLYDHRHLKGVLENGKILFLSMVAAFLFAFGFSCFITPANTGSFKIATGGISGLSQITTQIVAMISDKEPDPLIIEAIGYSCFNLPIVIFAFFCVGKKFAIHTAINVGVSSLFIWLIDAFKLTEGIANNPIISDNIVARIVFGGACIGISSALAFKAEISCGGMDVITYYLSLRKSTSVGKYNLAANSIIVGVYALLIIISDPSKWYNGVLSLCISIAYLFVVAIVIDAINLRNKKIRIEIITSNIKLPNILLAHFPHGATLIPAKGAYSGTDKIIIYTIVTSYEVSHVTDFVKKADPHAFVAVSPLTQVYGNFFIKPIE